MSNTVDTVTKDNLLAYGYEEGRGEDGPRLVETSGRIPVIASWVAEGEEGKDHPGIYVQFSEDCTAYAVWYPKYECYVAIRKLTPRECFRLQAFSDEDFDRAAFVNSKSQLYKQAGNSITTTIARAIGEKLAVITEQERSE